MNYNEFINENIIKISNLLLKRNAELWAYTYPCFSTFSNYENIDFLILEEVSIYIHIPFCEKKCKYCSYFINDFHDEEIVDKYFESLIKEIDLWIVKTPNKPYISSLLVWWWTPTLLKPIQISILMEKIRGHFKFDSNTQFTIETTPSRITENMASVLKKSWFDRVSIWVQSFNESTVKLQNRLQENINIYKAFSFLRNYDFPSINIDLIYWLNKWENIKSFLKDNISHILKLKPDSVHIYPNQDVINNKSLLNNDVIKDVQIISNFINWFFDKNVAIPILNVWLKWVEFDINSFPYNRSKYTYDIRFLKQKISFWLWAIWNFFDNDWNFYYYKFDVDNILDYSRVLDNEWLLFKYKFLNHRDIVKSYFVRNLRLWISKSNLKIIFSNKKNKLFIEKFLLSLKDFIIENETHIFLKEDYHKELPFFYKNDIVNFFIFSFFYIYDDNDRNKFYNEVNSLIL